MLVLRVRAGLAVMAALAAAATACTHDFYGQLSTGGSSASGATTGTQSTTASSSTGGPSVQVKCGQTTCTSPAQACCAAQGQAPSGCMASCTGELAFTCDGPEDCPGGQCCFHSGVGASCQSNCGASGIPLCRTDNDCGGNSCSPSSSLSGFSTCH